MTIYLFERLYSLSQAMVKRITQLGREMYEVTRLWTSLMSLSFPPLPTLAIKPGTPRGQHGGRAHEVRK